MIDKNHYINDGTYDPKTPRLVATLYIYEVDVKLPNSTDKQYLPSFKWNVDQTKENEDFIDHVNDTIHYAWNTGVAYRHGGSK